MKVVNIKKFKFIFFSLKRNFLPILFCLFTIFLVIFSKQNFSACKGGLELWVNNVVPSLFPFFIATELLSYTNIIYKLGKLLNPIMKPLFNVSGIGTFPLIMGIISGYPIGAKIVTNFRENNLMEKDECERLLAFTNNSGPLFILGTVGISMFYNSTIGILLLITHLLACITVGIIFRFWKCDKKDITNQNLNVFETNTPVSSLGEILKNSILSATSTIIMIGGFIVLFSVILSILKNTNVIGFLSYLLQPIFNIVGISNTSFSTGFISGILEITNGLKQIISIPCKQISTTIILSAFLLGCGGISVLMQVWAIISKTDISIKPYIIGKILQGIFASIYTYIFIKHISIFNLNL